MVIVLTIITVLVIALGIMAVVNTERLNQLQDDYYNVEERALCHFRKLMEINRIIRQYEKEGKKFIAIEDIKRTINSDQTIR